MDKKFRNTNDKLNEYLSRLDTPSRERLEIEAIKNTLERNIKETMGGKIVVDYSGMLKTLKDNPNYKSEAAKKAIEITEKMNKIHGLDHTLADAFKAPKDPKLQQGLSHNVAVRYLTMAANRAVQNTVKFLPFLQMGKTAASRHAIYNAVMSSSSARELGEKLSKAAMNKDIPVSEKIDIIEMAKAQFKFSNELDKAKADGIVKETAEQGSKLEQAEAKQEVVKGEGWTMRDGKLTYLDQVKFELNDWLKDQTGIDAVTASLAWLKSEHPEMHENKRVVKELIEYVLDRPSVVKNGKSENSVYLGKADGKKMKDIVIDKGDKKIIHANRRKMTSEEKEAKRASEDSLHSHTDTKPAGALTLGQDARLARFNDSIIPQNSADRLVEKIIKLDDAEKIGNMLRKTIISKDISTKTKLAAINAAKRRLVAITAKNTQKDDKKQK